VTIQKVYKLADSRRLLPEGYVRKTQN